MCLSKHEEGVALRRVRAESKAFTRYKKEEEERQMTILNWEPM
jgi:hypothetical protein